MQRILTHKVGQIHIHQDEHSGLPHHLEYSLGFAMFLQPCTGAGSGLGLILTQNNTLCPRPECVPNVSIAIQKADSQKLFLLNFIATAACCELKFTRGKI
jgi:hypothetical protein